MDATISRSAGESLQRRQALLGQPTERKATRRENSNVATNTVRSGRNNQQNETAKEIDLTKWIMQDSFRSQRKLVYPVAMYVEDNYRENFLKHSGTLTFGMKFEEEDSHFMQDLIDSIEVRIIFR